MLRDPGFRLARRYIYFLLPSLALLSNVARAQSAPPEMRDERNSAPESGGEAKQQRTERPRQPQLVIEATKTMFERRFIADPRVRPKAAEGDLLRFAIHGEYQLRYGSVPRVPLNTYGLDNYRDKLGQTHRLEHRLRFSPRFSYRRQLAVISQFDLPKGMLLGQRTDHVSSDAEPLNEQQPMRSSLRELYADLKILHGSLLIGQQAADFGLGLVDNSGDHRQFLGDSRLGTLVERFAYRGRPLGAKSPWELLLATDYVFSDGRISATRGDHAIRAVLGNRFAPSRSRQLGLQIIAEQLRPNLDAPNLKRLSPDETSVTFDVTGQTVHAVAGTKMALLLEGEFAYVTGTTNLAAEVLAPKDAQIRRAGAIARVGLVRQKTPDDLSPTQQGLLVEFGYASGDANPGDGVDRRFTMNPARRVGIVLFDEVLRWKTARAATALGDSRLGAQGTSAGWSLASNGGVPSATYLAAEWLYRPITNFDVRLSAMIAQASSDVVDPVQIVTRGVYRNFDGGLPSHRDLGAELDVATEYRKPLENGLSATIGAEAGLLLPGAALTGSDGNRYTRQGLVRGRFGFYF